LNRATFCATSREQIRAKWATFAPLQIEANVGPKRAARLSPEAGPQLRGGTGLELAAGLAVLHDNLAGNWS